MDIINSYRTNEKSKMGEDEVLLEIHLPLHLFILGIWLQTKI